MAADNLRKREAPPGSIAIARFCSAAKRFVAPLTEAIFPLQQRVYPYEAQPEQVGDLEIIYDANPWGYGAVRSKTGI